MSVAVASAMSFLDMKTISKYVSAGAYLRLSVADIRVCLMA